MIEVDSRHRSDDLGPTSGNISRYLGWEEADPRKIVRKSMHFIFVDHYLDFDHTLIFPSCSSMRLLSLKRLAVGRIKEIRLRLFVLKNVLLEFQENNNRTIDKARLPLSFSLYVEE